MQPRPGEDAGQCDEQIEVAHADTAECRARADAADAPADAEERAAKQALTVERERALLEFATEQGARSEPRHNLEYDKGERGGATQHQQQAKVTESEEVDYRFGPDHGGPSEAEAEYRAADEGGEMVQE